MKEKSSQNPKILWKEASNRNFDSLVSALGGHPLQTGAWGNAREKVDDIEQIKLVAQVKGEIIAAARVEIRRIPLVGKIAWIPKGPVFDKIVPLDALMHSLALELGQRKFVAYAFNPWTKIDGSSNSEQTIQIDLKISKDKLLENVDSKARYSIRKAYRDGVEISLSKSKDDLSNFFNLCLKVSKKKGFTLPGSEELIATLLKSYSQQVEVHFFVAYLKGDLVGGAVLMKSGRNTHYLWGAVDRNFSKYNIGQAIQWRMIEWSKDQKCVLYDMEGINPQKDPGTYNFKRKMGGEIIHLMPLQVCGLSLFGCLIAPLVKLKVK